MLRCKSNSTINGLIPFLRWMVSFILSVKTLMFIIMVSMSYCIIIIIIIVVISVSFSIFFLIKKSNNNIAYTHSEMKVCTRRHTMLGYQDSWPWIPSYITLLYNIISSLIVHTRFTENERNYTFTQWNFMCTVQVYDVVLLLKVCLL